jgi:hypothetical protein
MLLHLLDDRADRSPPLIGHRHQCSAFDQALFMELDVELFSLIPFPRGLDWESYIVVPLSQGEIDRHDGQILVIVSGRVKVAPQV